MLHPINAELFLHHVRHRRRCVCGGAPTVFNTGGRERVQATEESIVYFNNPTHM